MEHWRSNRHQYIEVPVQTSTYLGKCPPHNCSSFASSRPADSCWRPMPAPSCRCSGSPPERTPPRRPPLRSPSTGRWRGRSTGGVDPGGIFRIEPAVQGRLAARATAVPAGARPRHPSHPGARRRRAAGRDLHHSGMTDGAIHSRHDDDAHHPPARHHGHDHHHRRLRRLGRGRRRLGLRLGPAGRRAVDRHDPARRRAGDQLDRHGGRVRAGPLGRGGPARARGRSRRRAAVHLHQVRHGLG